MGDPRQKTSPRPPHPATVAQRAGARAPHPATVPRASIVQRFRAPSTRAPHPATVSASVVQRADNNRFALLNQVTQQNELKPAYARKLKAEAEKKDAEAAAREKARAEAKKRAELEQKRKEKAMRAQQQQRERKAARVEQSVGYEQDGSIDGRSHLDLEKACQLYAGQHGDDRTLERNVKFTTAMSTQTGRTCSRPSGVLTLSGLQGMSKRFPRHDQRGEATRELAPARLRRSVCHRGAAAGGAAAQAEGDCLLHDGPQERARPHVRELQAVDFGDVQSLIR